MNEQSKSLSVPLPNTVVDLIKQRRGKFEKTLNDIVEELYLKLWENQQFKDFLDAVDDGAAVEGSIGCDDHEAARMLRDLARKEHSPVKDKPLASFKYALKIVMRRYNMSRKERKIALGGEPVPLENGD
jgi:hypothetical protein